MPASSRVALVSLLLLLAGCSGGADTTTETSPSDAGAATAFNDMQTPSSTESSPASQTPGQTIDQSTGQTAASEESSAPPALQAPSAAATGDKSDMPADDAGIAIVPDSDADEQPVPIRKTLAGRWDFLLCDFGADVLGLLLEIEKDGDTYTAKVLDDTPMMPGWKITSAEITDQQADISFVSNDETTVNFEGSLDEDGVVRGNAQFSNVAIEPVRLVATRRENLDGADPKVPSVNVAAMESFQPDPDNAIVELREKLTELGDSALAYELARRLSAVFRGKRPDGEQYEGFPEQYLAAAEPWGERITRKAQLDIAYTMALCGYSIEQARKHLETAEAGLGEDLSESTRQRVATARGLIDLQSDDEQKRQQAMESLQQLRDENPFETNVTLGLATFHERNQQPEEALTLYAELAALPTGAGDMAPVERLWSELGRQPEELEDYLNQIYKQRAHQFAAEKSDAPRAEGPQQTILGELFTGAMCPPCVSADVATGGLEITFPESEFLMLRYHQHIPGPDPLTVQPGEQRARSYYGIRGTPSLYFNGQPIQVMSMYGPITNAADGYAELRQLVEQLLTQSTDLKITLEASASDGVVKISAGVEGAEEFPESWRLRLVLAEEEILFAARNGVRLHEMVVRAMPGGAEGVAAEEGSLKFAGDVNLDELRAEITSYVSQIPSLSSPPTDFSHLHLVAFVQDDTNHRILQAASIPVEGLAENAGAPAPATPDEDKPAEEKPSEENPADEKPDDDKSDESPKADSEGADAGQGEAE